MYTFLILNILVYLTFVVVDLKKPNLYWLLWVFFGVQLAKYLFLMSMATGSSGLVMVPSLVIVLPIVGILLLVAAFKEMPPRIVYWVALLLMGGISLLGLAPF